MKGELNLEGNDLDVISDEVKSLSATMDKISDEDWSRESELGFYPI